MRTQPMQAGKLRHRIQLQSRTSSQDTYGEPQDTWTTYATIWGNIEPLAGREFIEAMGRQSEVSHRIKTRYYSTAVTPDDRVKFGTRTFSIKAVLNIEERDREVHLMCSEDL